MIFICAVEHSDGLSFEDLWLDPSRPLDGDCIWWVKKTHKTPLSGSYTTPVDWIDEVQEKVDEFVGSYSRLMQGAMIADMIER